MLCGEKFLRAIFRPDREKETGKCRKLREELRNLCSSPNNFRIIKGWRMR
jgi:hypothetical protein